MDQYPNDLDVLLGTSETLLSKILDESWPFRACFGLAIVKVQLKSVNGTGRFGI